MNKNCTVKNCIEPIAEGDDLFCPGCRLDWNSYCELNGLEDNDIKNHMYKFQKGK